MWMVIDSVVLFVCLFQLPVSVVSLYMNFSGVFDRILEANHDNSELVRTAVVTQHRHVLTLLLYNEQEITGMTRCRHGT